MHNRFLFGQYKPADSFGHNLDPRCKIVFAVFLMILALFTTSALFYAVVIICLGLLMRFSGITGRMLMSNLGPFLILVLMTALYHLFFSARESSEVVNLFGFSLTEGGILMAIVFSLRIILFIAVAFFISLTTMPADLGETLVYFIRPLEKLRVPVNDIGLIIFIAMRFVPVLAEEFETIRKAQTIRGVNFSGSLLKRARRIIYLLIPVFQSAIRRADDLAIAIEARGYVSGAARSTFREFRFSSGDWIFLVVSIIFLVIIFTLIRI